MHLCVCIFYAWDFWYTNGSVPGKSVEQMCFLEVNTSYVLSWIKEMKYMLYTEWLQGFEKKINDILFMYIFLSLLGHFFCCT